VIIAFIFVLFVFVSGAAVTGASNNNSATELTNPKPDDGYIAPALTGKPANTHMSGGRDSEVSSLSSDDEFAASGSGGRIDDGDDEFLEARDNFDEDLAPPPTFVAKKSASPARDSRFSEDI